MFMNIEPEDHIPHLLPANLNCPFNLLDNGWCYHHTRFNICQLWELYHCLDLPVSLTISTRGHKASSEEAFIITLTKLATIRLRGFYTAIACIWVHLFPDFVEAIRPKLNQPQYGKLLFNNVCIVVFLDCKINETCNLGTCPLNDD
jgi:hypothetical protein